MNTRELKNYLLFGQVLAWILLFLMNFLYEVDYESPWKAFFFAFTSTFFLFPIVYIHYFFLLPLLIKGEKIKYSFLLIVLISICLTIYYSLDFLVVSDVVGYDEVYFTTVLYDVFMTIVVLFLSSLYYFVDKWFITFQKENQLKQEKLQTELSLLKSQINPHFLFNTLNNIYSYIQTNNPNASEMMERLSSILRYMVYDGSNEMVELNKEIQAIEDLLEIQKMKNSVNDNISFDQKGVKGFHLVAPLILLNITENACKHSDVVNNPDGYIDIKIEIDSEDMCHFKLKNTYSKQKEISDKYKGKGSANISKRIQLQYEDNHVFEEDMRDNVYSMNLSIPLERKR